LSQLLLRLIYSKLSNNATSSWSCRPANDFIIMSRLRLLDIGFPTFNVTYCTLGSRRVDTSHWKHTDTKPFFARSMGLVFVSAADWTMCITVKKSVYHIFFFRCFQGCMLAVIVVKT